MNANELADELEVMLKAVGLTDNRVPTMLRQQQAEIEALKMDIHSLTYGERLAKHFNKPVAWMQVHHKDGTLTKFSKIKTWEDDVPLYTHPAKTLTDEEIIKIYEDMLGVASAKSSAIDFARAILRKAQKK